MTDPDVQYLRDLARGYANTKIGDANWLPEYRRLQAIADRLESQSNGGTVPLKLANIATVNISNRLELHLKFNRVEDLLEAYARITRAELPHG